MKNSTIQVLRAFGIISVIFAHSNRPENLLNSERISLIYNNLGIIGVPIFLIISGFLFAKDSSNFKTFLAKKIKKLIIPWLIFGTIVYLYVTIRKGGISMLTFYNFIIGNGSYLYFMTILMFFYLFLYRFKKSTNFLLVLFLISFFYPKINNFINLSIGINEYLNPFYFAHYFIVGIFVDKYNNAFHKLIHTKSLIILSTLIFIFIFTNSFNINLHYFSINSFIFTYSLLHGIYLFAKRNSNNWILIKIGDHSYYIYLTHMIIIGFYFYLVSFIPTQSNLILLFIPSLVLISNLIILELGVRLNTYTKMIFNEAL